MITLYLLLLPRWNLGQIIQWFAYGGRLIRNDRVSQRCMSENEPPLITSSCRFSLIVAGVLVSGIIIS